jgi:hypothetical protein
LLLLAVPAQAQNVTSANCFDGGKVGVAECNAICPAGQMVLNCSYTIGQYSSGDTCTSISRLYIGSVAESGQPNDQPHDRCHVAAVCSDGGGTLSVQGFATCFTP